MSIEQLRFLHRSAAYLIPSVMIRRQGTPHFGMDTSSLMLFDLLNDIPSISSYCFLPRLPESLPALPKDDRQHSESSNCIRPPPAEGGMQPYSGE
jgi:hypothetical protein